MEEVLKVSLKKSSDCEEANVRKINSSNNSNKSLIFVIWRIFWWQSHSLNQVQGNKKSWRPNCQMSPYQGRQIFITMDFPGFKGELKTEMVVNQSLQKCRFYLLMAWYCGWKTRFFDFHKSVLGILNGWTERQKFLCWKHTCSQQQHTAKCYGVTRLPKGKLQKVTKKSPKSQKVS